MAHMGQVRTRRFSIQHVALGAVIIVLLLLAACGPTSTGGASPTSTPTPAVASTPTPGLTGYSINVYFSKYPESENSLTTVFPVARISPTQQDAPPFAVQLLIAGPTPQERAAGYYSELNRMFTNGTTCAGPSPASLGGPDFTLTLNMKGTTSELGTATLKFCRTTLSPGEGVDARVLAELRATLLQFTSIKKVAILTVQGHCFGDLSGLDTCLR